MNHGKHKFHNYILERVEEAHLDEAKALLTESFQEHDECVFSKSYLEEHFVPRMNAMLKTEHKEEVNVLMEGLGEG